ncbi:cation diffusion facilitator family transporter [Halopenitus malekzadehii]|uniref:Cation diffusion facilitator family transporter n=1 Tax=Halopenitus malekzadehii TaxID=1267564 RepID=A0A1H6HYQ0_9EURY|nr:cation diffusion facilitator family transporter [Halopenitus malekzadehii]SEH41442.1 cation diffusion facilitator family transporter [Halopenitus malekzadehii]
MTDEGRRFKRAAGVNVLGNAIKILVEGAAGIAFGSVALVADAAHSVADLVASLVVFVWGGAAYTDPDETHPHGHQRIEPLTALFVGAVIVLLGANLLRESALALIEGPEVVFDPLLLGALGFAMADMYLLYWYTMRVNADLGSTALDALAVDCLNDIYTTIAAAVGVLGVLLGYPILDAVAGGLVSLLVVYQGVEIARENVTYLVGAAPPAEKYDRVRTTLRDHPDVEGIHDLRVFYDGTDIEVEVHVEVDGEMTLRQAHDLETELMDRLRGLPAVGDAHVHLDPSGVGEWKDALE